jgi:PAS domain S-box-containing protein
MPADQPEPSAQKPWQFLKILFTPPQFGDSFSQQIVRILFYAQVLIFGSAVLVFVVGVTNSLNPRSLILILAVILLSLLALWVLRQKRLYISGSVLLLTLLGVAAYLLAQDEGGLHDIVILLYPAIVLLAGLIFRPRLLALFTLLSIFSIIGIAYLELSGQLDTYFNRYGYPDTAVDALAAVIFLTTLSFFVNYFVSANRHNILRLEQQEKSLRETSLRLQLAFEAAGLGDWELDLNTGLFQHSEFFNRFSGDPDNEIALNFIHPADKPAVHRALQSLAAGEQDSFDLTHRMLLENGGDCWARSWGKLIRDQAKKPAKITGLVMDITAQKRFETALQESEALYRQAIEAADAVPYFLDYQKKEYTFMGAGIQAITGYSAKEMTVDLFSNHLVQYGILIGEAAQFPFQEAVQRARRGEIAIWQTDNLIRTRSGELRWLLDSAIQVHNAQGEIYGSIGILQDITERKQAESEARKVNADLEKLVENRTSELELSRDRLSRALRLANMAYWEFNIAEQFFSFNDQFYDLLDTSAVESGGYNLDLNRYLNHFVHPEDRELLAARLHSLTGTEPDISPANQFEYRALRKNGEVQYVLVDYQIIKNEKSEPILAYGYHMDITQRKLAEAALAQRTQQLENANKELESFAYTISHDLRAPLRAVQGYSRILDEDYALQLSPDARRVLDSISTGALRMSRLIDDLLEFSRLGRQPIRRERVKPEVIIAQVLEELKPEYETRPVQFEVQAMPDFKADPSLMHLVYENLISNALKYSRGRSPAVITLGFLQKEGEAVYFVQDNGVGFDMTYAHKIFGVFQRLHTEDQYEGTGIGLATVQRILHRHGGRIWVEAELERGATFFFTLGDEILPPQN